MPTGSSITSTVLAMNVPAVMPTCMVLQHEKERGYYSVQAHNAFDCNVGQIRS